MSVDLPPRASVKEGASSPIRVSSQGSAPQAQTEDAKSNGKDVWDKLSSVGRLVGTLLTAVITAMVAYFGYSLNEKLKSSELVARLVEFDSSRQLSTARVRSEALGVFTRNLVPKLPEDKRAPATFAAFHAVYSDVLDTRSIFETFADGVNDEESRLMLRDVAKGVARRQALTLEMHGGLSIREEFLVRQGEAAIQEVQLGDHSLKVKVEDISYSDDILDSAEVSVSKGASHTWSPAFTVTYLDSPSTDNVALPHESGEFHHLSVLLESIRPAGDEKRKVTLELLHFPPSFAMSYDIQQKTLERLRSLVHEWGDSGSSPTHAH